MYWQSDNNDDRDNDSDSNYDNDSNSDDDDDDDDGYDKCTDKVHMKNQIMIAAYIVN